MNSTEPGEVQTLLLEPDRQMLLASLSFTVSHKVKPKLRCEVSYPGAKAMATSKDLHVTCMYNFDEYFSSFWLSLDADHFMLSSFTKRCSSSGPVPDGAGGKQCLVGLLV